MTTVYATQPPAVATYLPTYLARQDDHQIVCQLEAANLRASARTLSLGAALDVRASVSSNRRATFPAVAGQPSVSRTETELVRFVVPERTHPDSLEAIGIVAMAYELSGSADVTHELQSQLLHWLAWIEENLDVPDRFNRTTSKGWYRRKTRGISWIRASAQAQLEAFRALADIVERCGYETSEIRETRVGYVIYEDDVQVVAEPFRDTRRR